MSKVLMGRWADFFVILFLVVMTFSALNTVVGAASGVSSSLVYPACDNSYPDAALECLFGRTPR